MSERRKGFWPAAWNAGRDGIGRPTDHYMIMMMMIKTESVVMMIATTTTTTTMMMMMMITMMMMMMMKREECKLRWNQKAGPDHQSRPQ